jgi:hypothetical protein
MNIKDINSNIDFSDSLYRSCEMSDGKLIIYLNSWDNKTLKISFSNPIKFVYKLGSIVSGIYEKLDDSPFLDEALSRYYQEIPQDHPFKVFIIEDIEDFVVFEIVAEEAVVTKN